MDHVKNDLNRPIEHLSPDAFADNPRNVRCSDVPWLSDLCLISVLRISTMNQKSSIVQVIQFVQFVLNSDNPTGRVLVQVILGQNECPGYLM